MGKKKDMKRRIKALEATLAQLQRTPAPAKHECEEVDTRPHSKAEAKAQGKSMWYSGGEVYCSI